MPTLQVVSQPTCFKRADERGQTMINARAALLRIVTCMIGGIVCILVLRNFIPLEAGPYAIIWRDDAPVWDPNPHHEAFGFSVRPFWGIVGVGALLGLLPGIAWAMDQKSARRRFLVWSIMGVVIGFILSMASYRAEPMIVFSIAGVYVGVVSPLKRLGMYTVEEDNQAGDVSQLSE